MITSVLLFGMVVLQKPQTVKQLSERQLISKTKMPLRFQHALPPELTLVSIHTAWVLPLYNKSSALPGRQAFCFRYQNLRTRRSLAVLEVGHNARFPSSNISQIMMDDAGYFNIGFVKPGPVAEVEGSTHTLDFLIRGNLSKSDLGEISRILFPDHL
jgi:hypothetical protein